MKTDYRKDERIVLTLDAGGTNFVFCAMQAGNYITTPITLPSMGHCLTSCLAQLKVGFSSIIDNLSQKPVAISFAFPGPADYPNGIIGDLMNFPSFKGGIALGPFLSQHFGIPVFINNDGDLFAYGEAMAGALSYLNETLSNAGSPRIYRNLLGLTFGTGFGAGVVIGNNLLQGDNSCAGDIWCVADQDDPSIIVEENVSIRAVQRAYKQLSSDKRDLTPKDIFMIAEGKEQGEQKHAISAFEMLGSAAGKALCHAIMMIDGAVVIGGGLTGAAKYILPSLVNELNGTINTLQGTSLPRLQTKAYNIEDSTQLLQFMSGQNIQIPIPNTAQSMSYDPVKRTPIMLSKLGTSQAISLGAYCYALQNLDA